MTAVADFCGYNFSVADFSFKISSYRVFPGSLQAWKNGWNEIGYNDKEVFKILLNDEFVGEICSGRLQNTLKGMADNMDRALLAFSF